MTTPIATITFSDGTLSVPLVSGGGDALELRWRNTGMSDRWGNHPGGPPHPVFVEQITVYAHGYTILNAEMYGYTKIDADTWRICGPADYHYPVSRGGAAMTPIAGYEQCVDHHAFDGGDLVGYVRLVPLADPIEDVFLNDAITKESADLCRRILAVDESLIAKWSWLSKFAGRWTFDMFSRNVHTAADQRNFGWYLVPENFLNRYPYHPGGLPSLKHHRGLCTTIPGGSSCNEHEGHVAWYVRKAQKDYDLEAFHTALALARAQAAYGFIMSSPADDLYGLARNEAAGKLRGTCGQNPSLAKQWPEGLIAIDALLRGRDPLIREVVQANGDVLKSQRYEACYHGASGTRLLSHLLMNLRAHWIASGDEGFRAKAVQQITLAFTSPSYGVGTKKWWGNVGFAGESITMCYDEGLNSIVAWWIDQSPALTQFLPKLKEIVQHVLAYCVKPDGTVGYKWNPTDQVSISKSDVTGAVLQPHEVTYNGRFNGSWLMPLRPWLDREFPGVYGAMFDLIAHQMYTHYASSTGNGWATFDGAEGVSAEKMAGFLLNGTLNWWLT